jgi:hypothetical protein
MREIDGIAMPRSEVKQWVLLQSTSVAFATWNKCEQDSYPTLLPSDD